MAQACKVGTQPALVSFRYRYRLRPGLTVIFRRHYIYYSTGKWETGIVDRVNPDGYAFISLM